MLCNLNKNLSICLDLNNTNDNKIYCNVQKRAKQYRTLHISRCLKNLQGQKILTFILCFCLICLLFVDNAICCCVQAIEDKI